jgi:uncharacterized protein YgiM (DUF1202 family)
MSMEVITMARTSKVREEVIEETEVMETATSPVIEETSAPKAEKVYGVIANSKFVNMRKTPEIKSGNELQILQEGDKVTVLGESEGFYKIKFKGVTGYVAVAYCMKEV